MKRPKKLKGFNDFFGEKMRVREYVIDTFKKTFEKYGYEPLETPALEYSKNLLGQSGEEAEKMFYRFKDPGGRDVMMKFEVMTGMCRAVAENYENIAFPYKRYQIQRVWRAENTQKGRYREITQCDADTIGSHSMTCDGEFIQMGIEAIGNLGFKEYIANISNRKFLGGLVECCEITVDNLYGFAMSLDKIRKIGKDKVKEEMIERRGIPQEKVAKALDLIDQAEGKGFDELLDLYGKTVGTTEIGKEGLNELAQIRDYLVRSKVDEKFYRFDPTIARGLASYTGPVWEFEVIDGDVGSIGGCGRYDKIISNYVGRDVPATGGSFGIERITDILIDRNMVELKASPAVVLVTLFDDDLAKESLKAANFLRDKDIPTLLYPDNDKLGKQFKYADQKDIEWVIVLGPEEVERGVVQLKNMKSGDQEELEIEEVAGRVS
jgi:histidyl-tRNA synthetase